MYSCNDTWNANYYKIVIEKNDGGELSIYFADSYGKTKVSNIGHSKNIVDYANSVLKAVLLENSNIRGVLPELEIDDSVNLDKRKLNCLVSKMHNADLAQVAQELVTNKKDELGKAVLEAKGNESKEILVNSSILQEEIAEKLRENPENAKGPIGEQGPHGPKGEDGGPGKDGEQDPRGEQRSSGRKRSTRSSEIEGRFR